MQRAKMKMQEAFSPMSDPKALIIESFPSFEEDEDVLDYLSSAIADEPSMDVEELSELFSSFLLSHEICQEEDQALELCQSFHAKWRQSLGDEGVGGGDDLIILKTPRSMQDNFNTEADQSQV